MTTILDGKKISEQILKDLQPEIEEINKTLAPNPLRLDIVMVGNNPASAAFVKKKKIAGSRIGVEVKLHNIESTSTNELRSKVTELGRDKKIHGILVQLPLEGIKNEQKILDAVPADKDVDVLGYKAVGKFITRNKEFPILPSTLSGILKLLEAYGIKEFRGQNMVVVGAGKLVGLPAVNYFMRKDEKDATVTNVCRHTRDLSQILQMADVLISGAGNPGFIKGDMLKPGAIIVDAGTSKDPATGKLVGDIDFETVEKVASFITPVPGGVGPMTVAMIFYNLVELVEMKYKIQKAAL